MTTPTTPAPVPTTILNRVLTTEFLPVGDPGNKFVPPYEYHPGPHDLQTGVTLIVDPHTRMAPGHTIRFKYIQLMYRDGTALAHPPSYYPEQGTPGLPVDPSQPTMVTMPYGTNKDGTFYMDGGGRLDYTVSDAQGRVWGFGNIYWASFGEG